jgi:hypothetical protein
MAWIEGMRQGKKIVLVGHNIIEFDIRFLLHQLRRNDIELPPFIVALFDTYRVLQKYPQSEFGLKKRAASGKDLTIRSLFSDIAGHPLHDAHDALADARAAATVALHPSIFTYRKKAQGLVDVHVASAKVDAHIEKIEQQLKHLLKGEWSDITEVFPTNPPEIKGGPTAAISSATASEEVFTAYFDQDALEASYTINKCKIRKHYLFTSHTCRFPVLSCFLFCPFLSLSRSLSPPPHPKKGRRRDKQLVSSQRVETLGR